MDDKALAEYLGLTEKEANLVIPNLKPYQRLAYERMAVVEAVVNAGKIPAGVIVCRPRCLGK